MGVAAVSVFTRFELQPFVMTVGTGSTATVYADTDRTDIDEITVHSTAFQYGNVVLRDDGIAPDDVAGDGSFAGTASAPPDLALDPANQTTFRILRSLSFDLSLVGGGVETVMEDVAYAVGYVDAPAAVAVFPVAADVLRSENVINLVRPDFLTGAYPTIASDVSSSTQLIYQHLRDDFDWIALIEIYNSFGRPAGSHLRARNQIQGIGAPLFDNGALYGSAARLRGIIRFYFGHLGPATHEMFHAWGVFGFSAFGLNSVIGGGAHWGPIASKGEDTIFGFPSTLGRVFDLGGGSFCGPYASGTSPMGLELYLMGLAPSSAIGSHDFVQDASYVGHSAQQRCNLDFRGSGIGTIDGPALELAFGVRVPAYPDQSEFNIGMAVVSDRPLTELEFDYLTRLQQAHVSAFSTDTQNNASVTYFLPEPSALATLASGVALLMVLALAKLRGVGLAQ
jgi:hypothetical protein